MGIQRELGLRIRPRSAVRRAIEGVISSRPVSWLLSKIQHHFDRALFRATGGRFTAAETTGLPVVFVSTIGARSGREHTVPLTPIPFEDDLALIGSNWGGPGHPAWVHNLAANPTAKVAYRRRKIDVVVRPANSEETEEVFEKAEQVYLGYRRYRERTDRQIRVFVIRSATNR